MPKRVKVSSKYRKVKISNKNINKKNKQEYAKLIVLAIFLIIVTIGGSYALFKTTIKGTKQTQIVAGTLKVEYEDKNTIKLNNTSPLTDEEGLNQEPYTFTIKNIGTLNGKYTIYLEEQEGNNLDKSNIKYSIKEGDGSWSSPVLLSSGLILKENRVLEKNQEETYQIKMWLKEDATNEVQGQTYSAKVVVNVVQTNVENIVTTNPIINLNGESIVKINQNDEYIDTGVDSISSKEKLDINNIKIRYEYNNGTTSETVDKVDTSKVGIYYIYYEVEDSKGIKGISTRVVNVVKKGINIPTIILKGEETVTLDYKEKYIEAGYTARDEEDGELTDKVVVEGVVNSEVSGTYIIKYLITDSEGNTASVIRKVIVNKKTSDIDVTVNKEEIQNLNSIITISNDDNEDYYYAITTVDKKPGDSEYKLIEENTKINIIKNGRYYVYIKNKKGSTVKKTIDVTNIDETKPTCVFENPGYLKKGASKEIILTCTDPAGIATTSIDNKNISVSDETLGQISSITLGEKVENGYQYKILVTGIKEGNFKLRLNSDTVLDSVGNKNDEIFSDNIKVVNMNIATKTIKLDLTNTAEKQIEISGTNLGKITYQSSNNTIASVTSDGIVKAIAPGKTQIIVTEENGNITDTVEVEVVKTLTAYFTKNGPGVESLDEVRLECEVIDSSGLCSITLPKFTTKNEYKVIGWGKSSTATEGIAVGTNVQISENTTYYSISGKDITATFIRNGALSLDEEEENIKKTCTIFNSDTSCSITSPVIIGSTSTPIVIGFSMTENDHISIWDHNTTKKITSNVTYYAQTKSDAKDLVSKFMISSLNKVIKIENSDGVNVTNTTDSLEEKCQVDGTYNGEKQATTCIVETPFITVATGYINGFWNKDISASTGVNSGNKVEIEDSDIYYANAVLNQYKVTYNYKANGGTEASKDSDNFTIGSEIDLTPTATKEGYTFVGWNTTQDAKEGLPTLKMGNSNITLYAIYRKDIEATFYYYDGQKQAILNTNCSIFNKEETCNYELPEVVKNSVGPSMSEYQGVAATISSTTPITNFTSVNTSYYAYYKNIWNLTYIKGAGVDKISKTVDSCTSFKTTNGVEYQESTCDIELPTITAQKGYTVEGWYNADGGKISSPYKITKTETLISKTNINKYTVTYDYKTNGGSNTTKSSDTVSYGDKIDLTPTATKQGYTFVGWNTDKDATVTLDDLVMDISDVTLYAIYRKEAITYTAKFDANGAILSSTENKSCTIPAVYNNDIQATSCTVIAPTITRDGYTSIGYNTSASARKSSDDYLVSTSNLTLNESTTWYAITSKDISATFYYYDGTDQAMISSSCSMYNNDSNCTVTIPTTVTSSSGPSSTKYIGISKELNSSTEAITPTEISEDITYYAFYNTNISATFYYYDGSAQQKETSTGTKTATTNGTEYEISNSTIAIPTAVSSSSGPSSTKYAGVSTEVSSTTKTTPTTANTTYYAFYNTSISATFYYYDGSAQQKETSIGTKTATTNGTEYEISNGTIAIPTAVSSSSGPSSTKYAGVSTEVSSTTKTTPTTANTIYYAFYNASISATFYYYDGAAQQEETVAGIRTATTNKTEYSVNEGNITVPTIVTSSSGINSSTYQGVSTEVSSTTKTTPTTANTTYYAFYMGKWTATFQKGANISEISSTAASCDSYKTTDGVEYTSIACSIPASNIPSITVVEGYVVLGWFLPTNITDVPDLNVGKVITLNDNITYTAKARLAVASEVSYDNSSTGLLDEDGDDCKDVQCAIDSINRILDK